MCSYNKLFFVSVRHVGQCVVCSAVEALRKLEALLFCVIHFRVYDQYTKTEPSYAEYDCLFI